MFNSESYNNYLAEWDAWFIWHKPKKPIVSHNNPEDYGLTIKDVEKTRLRYLRKELKPIVEYIKNIERKLLVCESNDKWLLEYYYVISLDKINKIKNTIRYMKNIDSGEVSKIITYDLDQLKSIPLDKIIEFTNAGFARVNPLRTEKSPSNSFHWNKNTNRWTDYGTGEYGDIIDLVMKINDIDFREACKHLTFCN